MWTRSQYKCPICADRVWYTSYGDNGHVYESETECRGCRLYRHDFSYGQVDVRVGFASFQWSWSGNGPNQEQWDACRREETAAAEMYAHPEFRGMRRAPLAAVADWLGEHEFYTQESAVREQLAYQLPAYQG